MSDGALVSPNLTRPRAADAFVAGPAERTRGPDKDLYYAEKARLAAEEAVRKVCPR